MGCPPSSATGDISDVLPRNWNYFNSIDCRSRQVHERIFATAFAQNEYLARKLLVRTERLSKCVLLQLFFAGQVPTALRLNEDEELTG